MYRLKRYYESKGLGMPTFTFFYLLSEPNLFLLVSMYVVFFRRNECLLNLSY